MSRRDQDELTLAKILESTRVIDAALPARTYMGFKIVASPFVPDSVAAVQMDPDCDPQGLWCTPALRAETDRWLLERFGTKQVAYVLSNQQMIAMSDRMLRRMEADIDRLIYRGSRL